VRTTLTEIGGYLNNCETIVAGNPQCPETKPLVVEIRPAKDGAPDPDVLLASFELSHDNDPLTVSYESASPHLELSPGTYFALFGPQQDQDVGFLLGSASIPFSFTPSTIILGNIAPDRVLVDEVPAAVRILGRTVAVCDPALAVRGCWHFDEPAGTTTATDSSTFANHGTYLGGVTLGVPGVFDTAVSLDGVNDVVRVPDANSLDVGDTFSAEGWIKRSSTASTHSLMNKGNLGLQLVVTNAGSRNRVFLRKANVSTIAQSSVGVPADGKYHHVVATKNGAGPGTAKIYVDGVDVTVPVSPAQIVQNTAFPLSFGSGSSTRADFDEFALYDRALTPAEVTARFTRVSAALRR